MNPNDPASHTPLSGAENIPPTSPVNDNIIEEKGNDMVPTKKWIRGKLLGKGGFAKCYEIREQNSSSRPLAVKMIPKSLLTKDRARQKVVTEIKIHKSMKHSNIVTFDHVFEDAEHVYIIMELCKNQTLNELVKRRTNLTEIETRYYLSQLVTVLQYLQDNQIIHRDLKLSNLFLSEKLEIKLGDFGLAAKLTQRGERRKTICGTPNYLAPEILDNKLGHSFEVDIWSLGVICYTLLIGRPPFESPDVKSTYKRIRSVEYSFPEYVPIHEHAKQLIESLLVFDDAKRLTLHEIRTHPFLTAVEIPVSMPLSTLDCPPTTASLKAFQSPLRKNIVPRAPPANSRFSDSQSIRNMTCDKGSALQKTGGTLCGLTQHLVRLEADPSRKGMGTDTLAAAMLQDGCTNTGTKVLPFAKNIESEVHVLRWKDLSSKFGVGYYMSNKTVGVYFNDASKMVLSSRGTYYEYYEKATDKVDVVSRYNSSEPLPAELKKKSVILQSFKKALENEIAASASTSCLKNTNPNSGGFSGVGFSEAMPHDLTESTDESAYLPFVKKWTLTSCANIFRLNTKVVQVIFNDGTQILLSAYHKRVIYTNKKGEKTVYEMKEAFSETKPEFARRMKYAKELVAAMLSKKEKGQQTPQNGISSTMKTDRLSIGSQVFLNLNSPTKEKEVLSGLMRPASSTGIRVK